MKLINGLKGLTLACVVFAGFNAAAEEKAPAAAAPAKKEAVATAEKKDEKMTPVPYPTGYRDWKHIKSMAITSEKHPLFAAFGGIHHVYANPKATEALKNKKPFTSGATLVLDLLETSESGGAFAEGKRKFIGVMVRDEKKYAATEGWGWEVFEEGNKDKRAVTTLEARRACATCHKEVAAHSFVFAEYRD